MYGGDLNRFFVSGHSAGGHLASLITTDPTYLRSVSLDPSIIKGVISVSGIYSLLSPMTVPEQCACSFKTLLFQRLYVRPTFGYDHSKWLEASPIEHIQLNKQFPPFFLINAQHDLGLDNGTATFYQKYGFTSRLKF
jgi:acetyl esterase/lipase